MLPFEFIENFQFIIVYVEELQRLLDFKDWLGYPQYETKEVR